MPTPLIPDQLIVQVGKETTWGTPVSATAKLMGIEQCDLEPIVDAAQVDEMRGSQQPAYLSNLTKVGAKARISGVVTSEDIPYWQDALFGIATPTGANPYTYAYTAPSTTLPTARVQTLIKGSGSNTYKGEGMVLTDFEISCKANEPWKFMANLVGEEVSTGSLAALSDRTVNVINGNTNTLFIDAMGGTVGTTAISTAWMEFRLKVGSNRGVFPTLGALKPAGYFDAKWKGAELFMRLMFDATTKAYVDAIIGASGPFQKLIRIKGTKSASNSVQLDFAGTALNAPNPFTTDNGIVVVDFKLAGEYDSGAFANFLKMTTVNTVSALP